MKRIENVGIIGGGLSGLAAGLALVREGFHVALFEANDKLGGCCATTLQDGYTFNDGAMYVALPELLDRAFEKLGLDRATSLPLRHIDAPLETTLADGTVFSVAAGNQVSVSGTDGAARTSKLQAELAALLDKWRPVLRLFADDLLLHPPSLPRLLGKAWRHLPKFRGTVATELGRSFSDPAVRAAMSGVLLYTGLPPRELPVAQIVGLVALFDSGFHLPAGGMGAIADALSTEFIARGGQVHLGARVNKIQVAGNRVTGLELVGRDAVPVDAVISTVSGMLTFGSLLDQAIVPRSLRRKVARAPLSQRALSVQLGLANRLDATSHTIAHLPMLEQQHQALAPGSQWMTYSIPTVTMPELAPAGGSIIEVFPAIDQRLAAESWTEAARDAAAQSAIESLSHLHRLDIATVRVRSPRDYSEALHLYQGAVYGLSPAAGPTAQFPHRTPIEGLFQAGQTTYPGYGTSTAMLSGSFAADALIERARQS